MTILKIEPDMIVEIFADEEGPGEWLATVELGNYIASSWGKTRDIAIGHALKTLGETLDPNDEGKCDCDDEDWDVSDEEYQKAFDQVDKIKGEPF